MACNFKADMPSLDILSDWTQTASALYLCVICFCSIQIPGKSGLYKSKFYKNKDTKINLSTK